MRTLGVQPHQVVKQLVEEVLNIFTEKGFAHATVIDEMMVGNGRLVARLFIRF